MNDYSDWKAIEMRRNLHLLILGVIFLMLGPVIYWIVRGGDDRYIRIINTPSLDALGSGPVMLWVIVIPTVIGVILLLMFAVRMMNNRE